MSIKRAGLLLWEFTPSWLRARAKRIKNYFNWRFENLFYCESQQALIDFCNQLDKRELNYVILDLPDNGKVTHLSLLTDSDDFSLSTLLGSISALKFGKRLLRRKFISVKLFHTDGIEGKDIRYERAFAEKILSCRIANRDGIYTVARDLKLSVVLNDLMFFYFAISPTGQNWKKIPSSGLREFYNKTLQPRGRSYYTWEQCRLTLINEAAFPNLDYFLFRSRQSKQLIPIANHLMSEYDFAPTGLAVFCLLSNFDSDLNREKISRLLHDFRFTNIRFQELNDDQSRIVMDKFRSGRWSVGRATSGGEVRTLISCISTNISKPINFQSMAKFPIDDMTVQKVKLRIRDELAGKSTRMKGTQIIHSSDCSRQAQYYLLTVFA